jgi:hypothetical protein
MALLVTHAGRVVLLVTHGRDNGIVSDTRRRVALLVTHGEEDGIVGDTTGRVVLLVTHAGRI